MTAAAPITVRAPSGATVLIAPRPGTGVVAVCLHLSGGLRAEPVPALAHLCEHLLCRSEFDEGAAEDAVTSVGGVLTARTTDDYVEFQHVLPGRENLRRLAGVIGARLRPPPVSAQEIRTQLGIITAETARNIHQRPHGGLVIVRLPQLLFGTFANAHDGYSDLAALATVSPSAVEDHLRRMISPSRVTVAVSGDVDPGEAAAIMLEALTGLSEADGGDADLEPEADLTRSVSGTVVDPSAPSARTALGFRAPDPITEPEDYLATVLLSEVLEGTSDLAALRLRVGRAGNPFDVRGPGLLAAEFAHDPDAGEALLRQSLRDLAADGDLAAKLTTVQAQLVRTLLSEQDSPATLASWLCVGSAIHGTPNYVLTLPARLRAVSAGAVAAVALRLAVAPAARVTSTPEVSGDRDAA